MIHKDYDRLMSQAQTAEYTPTKTQRFARFFAMSSFAVVVALTATSVTMDYNRMLGDSMAETIDNASFALTKHSIFKPTAQYREFLLNKTMKEHPIKEMYFNWPYNLEDSKEATRRVHIIRDLRVEGVFKDESKFNKVYGDLLISINKNIKSDTFVKDDSFEIEKNSKGVAKIRQNIEDVRVRLFINDKTKVDSNSPEYQAKYKSLFHYLKTTFK